VFRTQRSSTRPGTLFLHFSKQVRSHKPAPLSCGPFLHPTRSKLILVLPWAESHDSILVRKQSALRLAGKGLYMHYLKFRRIPTPLSFLPLTQKIRKLGLHQVAPFLLHLFPPNSPRRPCFCRTFPDSFRLACELSRSSAFRVGRRAADLAVNKCPVPRRCSVSWQAIDVSGLGSLSMGRSYTAVVLPI